MPRRMTRAEALKHLGIRACMDAVPAMTCREAARLFCTSSRAAMAAKQATVGEWALRLVQAPEGKRRPVPVKRTVARCRPGDRARARLVAPEQEPDLPDEDAGIDVEPPLAGVELELQERERAVERELDRMDDAARAPRRPVRVSHGGR